MAIEEYVINIREWKLCSVMERKPFYIAEVVENGTTIRVWPEDYEPTELKHREYVVYKLRRNDDGVA